MPISAALVSTFVVAQAVLAAAPTPVAVRLSSDVAECPSSDQVQSVLRQVLRGNIYREVLRDLDHAEREYARGAESGGRVGDDSRFLRAVCLEALGRVDEARKAYEAYLLQAGAAHAQEAKRRLDGLRP
jgi:hypothetical protein